MTVTEPTSNSSPTSPSTAWIEEGQAKFKVAGAFYRPKSKMGRDLAILAAKVYHGQQGSLRVLDAMTGSGVRPLRYQIEAGANWVWANEANPDLREVLSQNLAQGMRPRTYRITHQDANQLFFTCHQQRDFYDLVDIDSFGSPVQLMQTGLMATKIGGLLYLTSTDARTTSGHNPDKCLQVYGAYARNHPAVHEQGLRLLLGGVAQQAAMRGMHIQPIFSFFNGQIHRVMVRLMMQSWDPELYGFLAYCHGCGQFQTVDWRHLGRVHCICHDTLSAYAKPRPPVLSGPLWLGPLHDESWLQKMSNVASDWGWATQVKLIKMMKAEASMPPYYYPLSEIGRRGQMDIPPRDRLIKAICATPNQTRKEKGQDCIGTESYYRATLTHMDFQAIKTDAPLAVCLQVAKTL